MLRIAAVLLVLMPMTTVVMGSESHAACDDYTEPHYLRYSRNVHTNMYGTGTVARSFMTAEAITLKFEHIDFDRGVWGRHAADCVEIVYHEAEIDPQFYQMLGSQLPVLGGRSVTLEYYVTDQRTGHAVEWIRYN